MERRVAKATASRKHIRGIQGTGVFEPLDPTNPASSEAANGVAAAAVNGAGASGRSEWFGQGQEPQDHGCQGQTVRACNSVAASVPRIAGSKIGFVVNGVPQGIAFRDLFDFRPLRVKGFSDLRPAPLKPTGRTAKQDPKKPEPAEPVINIRARENVLTTARSATFPLSRATAVHARGSSLASTDSSSRPPRTSKPHWRMHHQRVQDGRRWKSQRGWASGSPWRRGLRSICRDVEVRHAGRGESPGYRCQAGRREGEAQPCGKRALCSREKKHAAALARNSAASSPHPEHEPDATDADTTITAQHDARMDEDTSESAPATVSVVKLENASAQRPVEKSARVQRQQMSLHRHPRLRLYNRRCATMMLTWSIRHFNPTVSETHYCKQSEDEPDSVDFNQTHNTRRIHLRQVADRHEGRQNQDQGGQHALGARWHVRSWRLFADVSAQFLARGAAL
ncbi:hypothetical protein L1887_47072 [Cichorium endivia]|nr:hypothetical protein L1887_47072 [Cichorium endivia]